MIFIEQNSNKIISLPEFAHIHEQDLDNFLAELANEIIIDHEKYIKKTDL